MDLITIDDIKSRMLLVRGNPALLDRDVAALYGVETRVVNQAVKRNSERFTDGYILELTPEECSRSQIVTLNGSRGSNLKYLPHAFTERGLYMLATVLKSPRAIAATHAIIETYAQLRSMVADMEALQHLKDGSREQAKALTSASDAKNLLRQLQISAAVRRSLRSPKYVQCSRRNARVSPPPRSPKGPALARPCASLPRCPKSENFAIISSCKP